MTTIKINAKKVAKLAFLFVTDEEEKVLDNQLETTIKHVENLNNINTDHITGTNEVTDLKNVIRKDETRPSLTQEQALQNAKHTYNGFFVVPAVLEE